MTNDSPAPSAVSAEQQEFSLEPNSPMLEALAEFAAGAGHDINNPAAVILGRVQLLKRRLDHPADQEMLNAIGTQALRIRDMISDLMLFARPIPPQPQTCNLKELISHCSERFQADHPEIALQCDCPSQAIASVDPTQFQTVVEELLANACLAMEEVESPCLEIHLQHQQATTNKPTGWKLTISDNGHGVTDLQAQHMFHPFYSGRSAGRGLGFGLPKCWQILKMHNGNLIAQPRTPNGMTFCSYWPAPE